MQVPLEQFRLTTPVNDLGYIALSSDSAHYELVVSRSARHSR
ncbi:MAG TPA: hypothetical protein VF690_00970 [Hymenobacter sp.]